MRESTALTNWACCADVRGALKRMAESSAKTAQNIPKNFFIELKTPYVLQFTHRAGKFARLYERFSECQLHSLRFGRFGDLSFHAIG